MRTGNSQRYDEWDTEEYSADNIIYLYDQRPVRSPKRGRASAKSDVFWDTAFIVLCLSVVVCLFLH